MERWKRFVQEEAPAGFLEEHRLSFQPPVSEQRLHWLERELNIVLPADLHSLLVETDGLRVNDQPLVWSAEQMGTRNQELRRSHPAYEDGPTSYNDFLFFSPLPGNRDLYGYCLTRWENCGECDIVLWDNESNEITFVAPDLESFLKAWLHGKL